MNNVSSDHFRIKPVEQTIEPLLESFARALRNMPVLEEAVLYSHTLWHPEENDVYAGKRPYSPGPTWYRWSVRYVVSEAKNRLEWRVGDWRPSEVLLQQFHDLGGGELGKRLEAEWMDIEWSRISYHYSDIMPPTESYLILNPLGRRDCSWP